MINFLNIRNHFHQYHTDKSPWAYYYCIEVKDKPEVRQYITVPFWAYEYCYIIKDRPEVYKYITSSLYAYRYCITVKDRPSVRQYITEEKHLKNYQDWKNKQ